MKRIEFFIGVIASYMGIPDTSFLDLIEKVRSWVSWGGGDLSCLSQNFDMQNSDCKMCCECNTNFNEMMTQYKYNCQSCGRWLCGKCMRICDLPNLESDDSTGIKEAISSCKFCSVSNRTRECQQRKCVEKVHPAVSPQESPRQSPEPNSPCLSGETERDSYFHDRESAYYAHSMLNRSLTSSGAHSSSISTLPSTFR